MLTAFLVCFFAIACAAGIGLVGGYLIGYDKGYSQGAKDWKEAA